MKVLVTGANGYLGKGVVSALLHEGVEVVATDFRTENINPNAKRIAGDIFELADPYAYFGKPEVLLHMAWRDGFVHNSINHIIDLPKHMCFLTKMFESGVKQISVMGSMHEIGFYEGCISEHTACNPLSLYGISKNALRQIIEMEGKKNAKVVQWLRAYYIVGNTCDGNSVFSKLVRANEQGEKEFPFTMGQNQYDFLDYAYFCKLVAHCVMQSEINGIVDICSGKPEKLAERVERFIKENDLDITLKYGAYPDRAYDSKAIWGNSKKIAMIEKNRGTSTNANL